MKPETFSTTFSSESCRVSIIIKALNEEKRISAAIESALRAVSAVGGEVVLADSCSTDATVKLAQAYPIRIVQLTNPDERRCGVGPQLGFQHSRGEFVYILDGDMEMLDGFLEQALDFMVAHPDVAGVGGQVLEQNKESLEYIARGERASIQMKPGSVDRLDLGGLYRRSSIDATGYFSDRNLHSYEEFDLAVRLRSLGWKLWRLPAGAANHFGHDAPPYNLLMRRWRNSYLCGIGELVHAAVGKPHLGLVLQDLKELRIYVSVLIWWVLLISVVFWPLPGLSRLSWFAVLTMAPVAVMTWRKRSLKKAIYSVVSWCFNTVGLVRGLLLARSPATETISSRILKEPTGFSSLSTQGVPL